MPCEPYIAHKLQGKPHFCHICPSAEDIVYAGFEDVTTFLYVFVITVKVFLR